MAGLHAPMGAGLSWDCMHDVSYQCWSLDKRSACFVDMLFSSNREVVPWIAIRCSGWAWLLAFAQVWDS